MNLQQLEYFLASADRGSFSAAAEALHLAQPSVSEQVRRLEAELGVALFARVGRGVALTEAGRSLRPHAEAVLIGVREARESVASVRELRGGTISFGTFSTARDYLGSGLVAEFRRRHPNVRIRILGLNSAEAAEDVRAGRLEAAIVALPVDDDGLDVRPVADDELFFTSSDPSHLRRPMTIERLSELPLVLADASYRLDDPTRRQIAELAQRAGVTLEPVVDVETVATVLDLVADGVGDTVLERGLLGARGGRMSNRIGWVPFADPIMITLAFVSRRDAPLSPAAKVMVELVEERLAAMRRQLAGTPRRRLPA